MKEATIVLALLQVLHTGNARARVGTLRLAGGGGLVLMVFGWGLGQVTPVELIPANLWALGLLALMTMGAFAYLVGQIKRQNAKLDERDRAERKMLDRLFERVLGDLDREELARLRQELRAIQEGKADHDDQGGA